MRNFLREWWPIVLTLSIAFSIITFMLNMIVNDNRSANEKKQYCGKVIDKGYDAPSSGYKSHQDAQYWIVLMDQDIHQAIRVHVTPACYYDTNKDDHVCFILTARQMEQYGNTNHNKHLK